jgi:hypothetical protein
LFGSKNIACFFSSEENSKTLGNSFPDKDYYFPKVFLIRIDQFLGTAGGVYFLCLMPGYPGVIIKHINDWLLNSCLFSQMEPTRVQEEANYHT